MSVSVAVNTAPSENIVILPFLGAVSVAMVLWATGGNGVVLTTLDGEIAQKPSLLHINLDCAIVSMLN